jgi:hypothetical protein
VRVSASRQVPCFVVAYAPLEQSLFNPFDPWN